MQKNNKRYGCGNLMIHCLNGMQIDKLLGVYFLSKLNNDSKIIGKDCKTLIHNVDFLTDFDKDLGKIRS